MDNHDPPEQFWATDVTELLKQLASTRSGITETEADARLVEFGYNQFRDSRRTSLVRLLFAQFESPIIVLLGVAAALSFALGERLDALIILGILLVSGLLGFWQEYTATDAVERLLSLVAVNVEVIRDGTVRSVPREEVVPGDLVRLNAGDTVPADGRIVAATGLQVNEAALTGESFPTEKTPVTVSADSALAERTDAVFQGTHVVSGEGTVLVIRTGTATELGHVSARLARAQPKTEFERGIDRLGTLLLAVTLLLVLAIFAINVFFERPVLESFLFALALAVGLTPQLLPAIISVNLASGARRMARESVIVKRLVSIENLGSMDVLCSDKTGTLTEGVIQIHGAEDPLGNRSDRPLFYGFVNARFESGFENPIDQAITRRGDFDVSDYQKLGEVPYDFTRKRLSVLVRFGEQTKLVTKGAFENVLSICNSVETADGDVVDLSRWETTIRERFEQASRDGYRILGVAVRDLDAVEATVEDEREMTYIGMLLLEDPPKADVESTLRSLSALGVSLKLVTGDNRYVAAHVAGEVGFETTDVLTGDQLRTLSEEALARRASDVDVFAQIEPTQKERIVRSLSRSGHVVGHLGDGINDAPALRAADVGLSVDTAVDVAKDAADFVLLERDLSVLVDGIESGRRTFANTLKYIFMTTSANFGNMFSMAAASLFLPFLPLLPTQILLINLLSDVPAMTIPTDSVDTELVGQPQRWDITFIRNFMATFGVVSSAFDFMTFAVLLIGLHATIPQFRTGWFLVSVVSELLVVFVIRTRRPFYRSTPSVPLLGSSLLVAGLALLLPVSPLAGAFQFTPLPWSLLAPLFLVLVGYAVVTEAIKLVFFRRMGVLQSGNGVGEMATGRPKREG